MSSSLPLHPTERQHRIRLPQPLALFSPVFLGPNPSGSTEPPALPRAGLQPQLSAPTAPPLGQLELTHDQHAAPKPLLRKVLLAPQLDKRQPVARASPLATSYLAAVWADGQVCSRVHVQSHPHCTSLGRFGLCRRCPAHSQQMHQLLNTHRAQHGVHPGSTDVPNAPLRQSPTLEPSARSPCCFQMLPYSTLLVLSLTL